MKHDGKYGLVWCGDNDDNDDDEVSCDALPLEKIKAKKKQAM
jgi:hypothetical protein